MEGDTPQGSLTLPAPKIPAIPPRSSVICQDIFIYFFSFSWTRHINVSNITRALIPNKSNYMLMKCSRGILIRTQMLADNISEQLRTCALSLPKTGCNQKIPKKMYTRCDVPFLFMILYKLYDPGRASPFTGK